MSTVFRLSRPSDPAVAASDDMPIGARAIAEPADVHSVLMFCRVLGRHRSVVAAFLVDGLDVAISEVARRRRNIGCVGGGCVTGTRRVRAIRAGAGLPGVGLGGGASWAGEDAVEVGDDFVVESDVERADGSIELLDVAGPDDRRGHRRVA